LHHFARVAGTDRCVSHAERDLASRWHFATKPV
jgi:hypothetical protein